jgi:hypothetical protein
MPAMRSLVLAIPGVLLAGCGPLSPGYWQKGMDEASQQMSEQAGREDGGVTGLEERDRQRFKESPDKWYERSGGDDDAAADAVESDASKPMDEGEPDE